MEKNLKLVDYKMLIFDKVLFNEKVDGDRVVKGYNINVEINNYVVVILIRFE